MGTVHGYGYMGTGTGTGTCVRVQVQVVRHKVLTGKCTEGIERSTPVQVWHIVRYKMVQMGTYKGSKTG